MRRTAEVDRDSVEYKEAKAWASKLWFEIKNALAPKKKKMKYG